MKLVKKITYKQWIKKMNKLEQKRDNAQTKSDWIEIQRQIDELNSRK